MSEINYETEEEGEGMIDMVEVFEQNSSGVVTSLLQKYNDGRSEKQKIWSVGDDTKNGKILSFHKSESGFWYAITDTPSVWQKNNGITNGWSWIFQLESPKIHYSITDIIDSINGMNPREALTFIDKYFKQKNLTITRFLLPEIKAYPARITLMVQENTYVLLHERAWFFRKVWKLESK